MTTATGNTLERYAQDRDLIESRLEHLLQDGTLIGTGRLADAARYAVLGGGKRLRPVLLLSVLAMFRDDVQVGLDVAAAVELVHCASLILDDLPCMDDADLRRFRPAHHRAFGVDVTVLTAMSLLSAAFHLIHRCAGVDDSARQLMSIALHKAVGPDGLIGGQYADLHPNETARSAGRILRNVYHPKTASLFLLPVELGAILGGATPRQRILLQQYAENLGLAFQLYDDVLDTRPATDAGKSVGKDDKKQTFHWATPTRTNGMAIAELLSFATASVASFGEKAEMLVHLPEMLSITAEDLPLMPSPMPSVPHLNAAHA